MVTRALIRFERKVLACASTAACQRPCSHSLVQPPTARGAPVECLTVQYLGSCRSPQIEQKTTVELLFNGHLRSPLASFAVRGRNSLSINSSGISLPPSAGMQE